MLVMSGRALRTRLSVAVYRRTTLPFRLAFRTLAAVRSLRPIQTFTDGTPDPYLEAHTKFTLLRRPVYSYHRVFSLVSALHLQADPATLRVLSIGPRTEVELYYLWLFFGFRWKNLVGADLVSSSPKIKLADISMRLPFEANTFDVIVASHVLEKSRDPQRTRDEILRVAKLDARVLVGGDAVDERLPLDRSAPIPIRYFRSGVYGFIEFYDLHLQDIDYVNARSPHGYELIFRVSK